MTQIAAIPLSQPGPTPSPVPLPVVVSRDAFDWLTVWAGIAAAVVSVAAIVYAIAAFRHAKRMELKTERMIAAERRRVFELEVLRDLLDILDLIFSPNRDTPVERDAKARLSLFPGELPFWNYLADQDPQAEPDFMTKNNAKLTADGVPEGEHIVGWRDRYAWRVRWALLRDWNQAVDHRITAKPI
jgi:hypothetical protein